MYQIKTNSLDGFSSNLIALKQSNAHLIWLHTLRSSSGLETQGEGVSTAPEILSLSSKSYSKILRTTTLPLIHYNIAVVTGSEPSNKHGQVCWSWNFTSPAFAPRFFLSFKEFRRGSECLSCFSKITMLLSITRSLTKAQTCHMTIFPHWRIQPVIRCGPRKEQKSRDKVKWKNSIESLLGGRTMTMQKTKAGNRHNSDS